MSDLLQLALDDIVPSFTDETADWTDALARSRRTRPSATRIQVHRPKMRLRYAIAAVVLLCVGVTAVAFALSRNVINFGSAPSAPKTVVNFFGAQNVSAPPGMNPQAIPGKTRQIMSAHFDATGIHPGHGGTHVLYVAPTRKGGFCYLWTRFTGTCFDPHAQAALHSGPLGLTWMGNTYVQVLTGTVEAGRTEQVEVRFAGGGTATVPVTWVSAPINAGFFIYVVPAAHRAVKSRVLSVVALDAKHHVIGSQKTPTVSPPDQEHVATLPDGTRTALPARADVSTAKKLVGFRATDDSKVWLWMMHRRGGGTCYVYNQGSGCPPPTERNPNRVLEGGLSISTKRVLFFAETPPDVSVIELRYQDGSRERITPISGYTLQEVPPSHYKPGTRLLSAVGLDARGQIRLREAFQPKQRGVYPCDKPVARGYGVKSCP